EILLVPVGWKELQCLWHIGLIAKAKRQHATSRARRQLLELQAMHVLHMRCQGRADGQKQHTLMQHMVVLEAMQQGGWNASGIAREVDRQSRHALGAMARAQEIANR